MSVFTVKINCCFPNLVFARQAFVRKDHLEAKCQCLCNFQAILRQSDTCIVGYFPCYTKHLFSLWQCNICFENTF